MSFVGLVTRKDKATGVSLMAKVVTANKKRSAKKIFPVSVKANAMDDFTCCMIDHAAAVEQITTTYDMLNLKSDIALVYKGANNTVITYGIVNANKPNLSEYLSEDGKVIGRPKYGEGDAIGTIEITVSKGSATLTSSIQTTVKAIEASEVLSGEEFTQAGLWALIKNENGAYKSPDAEDYEWSGHNNISKDLNLVSSRSISSSAESVQIEWAIQDSTITSANSIYTSPRIDSSGKVSTCSYKDACTLVDNLPGITVEVIGSDNNALQNRVRIGGITLKATLTLGEVQKEVTLSCATVSKYLTNEEVMEVVLENIYITTQDDTKIQYASSNEGTTNTITAPSEGGTYTLRTFGNRGSELFEAPELKLDLGDIIGVTITSTLLKVDGSNEYDDVEFKADAFDGGFDVSDGFYSTLAINFDAFRDVTEDKKQFAIGATISISGYSVTGETTGGTEYVAKRYAAIKIDTSAMTTTAA